MSLQLLERRTGVSFQTRQSLTLRDCRSISCHPTVSLLGNDTQKFISYKKALLNELYCVWERHIVVSAPLHVFDRFLHNQATECPQKHVSLIVLSLWWWSSVRYVQSLILAACFHIHLLRKSFFTFSLILGHQGVQFCGRSMSRSSFSMS